MNLNCSNAISLTIKKQNSLFTVLLRIDYVIFLPWTAVERLILALETDFRQFLTSKFRDSNGEIATETIHGNCENINDVLTWTTRSWSLLKFKEIKVQEILIPAMTFIDNQFDCINAVTVYNCNIELQILERSSRTSTTRNQWWRAGVKIVINCEVSAL